MYLSIVNIILYSITKYTNGTFGTSLVFLNFLKSIFQKIEGFINYTFEQVPNNALNKLIIYMIIIFGIALLLLLPLIVFSKLYISYRNERYSRLFKKYSRYAIRFVMNELTDAKIDELKKIKSRFHRKVMIAVLIAIDAAENKEVSGGIRKFYLELKLNEDSIKKLRKGWHQKIRGIRELSHMRVKSENKRILDFLQKPNEILRIESQVGLIKLLPFVPFAFLDSQEKPFTVWEQINVFDLIRKNRIEIPEFHLWLNHWNDSVVMFCLDMIRVLKQKEAVPKVLELVNHDNELVKAKVIKTLVELKSKEAVAKLKELYLLEELPNQINIIKSIGHLRLESELEFLLDNINDKDFKIRMECCKSIALIGEIGHSKLKELALNADDELKRIIKHVLDPRI